MTSDGKRGPASYYEPMRAAVLVLSLGFVGCGRAGFEEMDGAADSTVDTSMVETGVDAAPDALPDATPDAVTDSAVDAPMDAVVDGTPDASLDAAMDSGSDGDAGSPCAAECFYDLSVSGAAPACTGSASVTASAIAMSQMTAVIDMTGFTSVTVALDACDVTGFSFHFGDSPTNDGYGGDAGSTSNDAEVHVTAGSLSVYGNDSVSPGLQGTIADVLPTAGCGSYEITFADQQITTPTMVFTGPQFLRIDPPTDTEGTPDALWYLGVNRTYGNAGRTGTGTTTAALCFR